MASEFFSLIDKYVPPLPASVLRYYYGTGFNDHSIYAQDGTMVGTVPQPSNPTPPAGGSGWLINGSLTSDIDYISIPPYLNGLTEGVIEFIVNFNDQAARSIFTSYVDRVGGDENNLFYCISTAGFLVFQLKIGGSGPGVAANSYNWDGNNHTVRFEFDATSTRIYVDNSLLASGPAWTPVSNHTTAYIGPNMASPDDSFGWGTGGLDGFMVANSIAQTYPPV
jgi:hypothetical protein